MDSEIFGKDFAEIYDARFCAWSRGLWPFLRKATRGYPPRSSAWLDLCCGTGALLEIVARRGFTAAGLDRSIHQLRLARKRVPGVPLRRGDVRRFSFPRTFEVITCLYDSLNYLLAPRDLERAFRCARRHLAPGGVFIFDMNTFEGLRDRWRTIRVLGDPRWTVLAETSFDDRTALGRFRLTGFVRRGRGWRRFEEEHRERGYRPAEIDRRLAAAGLAFRKLDAHTLRRPGKRSGRLLYVCSRRPS